MGIIKGLEENDENDEVNRKIIEVPDNLVSCQGVLGLPAFEGLFSLGFFFNRKNTHSFGVNYSSSIVWY